MEEKSKTMKPCPFCGGAAEIRVRITTLSAQATCSSCGVLMRRNYKGSRKVEELLRELIEESWNRRVED